MSLATQGRGGRRRGARAVFLSPRLGRAPWAGVFGAPFGAYVLRGDGASRAPGGEARAPRPSRARSECVSFWKRRVRGRGRHAGPAPEPCWLPALRSPRSEGFVVSSPTRVPKLSIFAHLAAGGEAGPGARLFRWDRGRVCPGGAGRRPGGGNKVGRTSNTPAAAPCRPVSALSACWLAGRCAV